MSDKLESYKVVLEVMAPVELTYKVLASSPEEALEKIRGMGVYERPKPILSRMKRVKATVYKWLYINVLHVKRY